MAQRRKPPSTGPEDIVDAALEIAEDKGWGALRLREVAAELGMPLSDLRQYFRDKDAVADAWMARADAAMLAAVEPGFPALPARERLFLMVWRWLQALTPHRRVTGEILSEKLYLGHPHHNVALVLWLSRTVQWVREAALLDAGGRRKQVEEIGLSALFVATLAMWVGDTSDGQAQTRQFLINRLAEADRVMARLWPERE